MPKPQLKILFVHQNFPGQFRHLAPALSMAGSGPLSGSPISAAQIVGLSSHHAPPQPSQFRVFGYGKVLEDLLRTHHSGFSGSTADLNNKLLRARACAHAALALKEEGFSPDIIIGHPGWGELLFLKDIWPQARLGGYCEFYYRQEGADVGFDPEFQADQTGPLAAMRLRIKNAAQDLFLGQMDFGISPTAWQRSLYPERYQSQISVIHDGIDTQQARPKPNVQMTLNNSLKLSQADEIITFVNRNLEPYRGYHQFMRALPGLLSRRPKARVIIVGRDGVSYGSPPDPSQGKTWREIFLNEVRNSLDMSRVHFVGSLPYPTYLELLQISSVHVYLTYPFVLSWSLLEAMSCGCPVVASKTAPVEEVVRDGETGLLCDFFSPQALQDRVIALLEDRSLSSELGQRARAYVVERFDLHKICLPRQIAWLSAAVQSEDLAQQCFPPHAGQQQ
jgi:glycosyltransferase involved in cell wall biosynthesis